MKIIKEASIPLTMHIDFFQTLNETSINEYEKLRIFREKIIEYCNSGKAVFYIFRVLKEMELELEDCLNGVIHINAGRTVIIKILRIIRIELDIIKIKMKNQCLMDNSESKTPKFTSRWTDDKLSLIELIYAIYKTKSVNNGNVTLKEIQGCFESLFQIKLGNISNRINEIDKKKEHNKLFLNILISNMNHFLDKINS